MVAQENGSSDMSPVDDLVTSRDPHPIYASSTADGTSGGTRTRRGAFLGFRSVDDLPASQRDALRRQRSLSQNQQRQQKSTSTTAMRSVAQPLMPDGGLSPCVIRVLGVGGGGCNAVRVFTL